MYQSEWLDIILIIGFVQGLFLSLVLWRKQNSNRPAVNFLVITILLLSFLMLGRATFQPEFVQQFAEVIMLPDAILFLGGPLVYFFTLSLLRQPLPSSPGIYWHYLPAVFHVLIVNTVLGLHISRYWSFLPRTYIFISFLLIELAAIVSFSAYFYLSYQLWRRYRATFHEKYAAPFLGNFLKPFFLLSFFIIAFWALGFLHNNFILGQTDYTAYVISWFLLVFSIYFLAYIIWSHPGLLELPPLREPAAPKSDITITEPDIQGLREYMEREKPYLDPEIKLGTLAEALDIPRHELSKIINHGFEKNFFDFINGYRVSEFIRLRRDERFRSRNLLELAYQAGFNSKSAFNRAFRKETGKSPSTFFTVSTSHFAKRVDS